MQSGAYLVVLCYARAMMDAFARAQNEAVRASLAAQAGCDVGALAREELTIVERPEPPRWPFSGMFLTCGTGTVICVTAPYLEWAHGLKLERHFYAFGMADAMARDAEKRGVTLQAWPPALAWSLARAPEAPEAPRGLRLQRFEKDWMTALQKEGAFHNACGDVGQTHRTFRNKFAMALVDDAGAPAAVAGVFDTGGLWEIGIDVARARRGEGVAPVVVAAAVRAILDAGETPYYVCGVGNIRSQHTAFASGFATAGAVSFVVEAEIGR